MSSKESDAFKEETFMKSIGSFEFAIIRPGGNDTCLIYGTIDDPIQRKYINDAVMRLYPNVEQVGFINMDPSPRLQMAGGEFCGNATRSTAWLALDGNPGEVAIRVTGVKNTLRAGITQDGEAFAQMPIYPDIQKVTCDPENPENLIVEMEGITQYINFDTNEIDGLTPGEIKQTGLALIRKKGLDRFSAAGVMYSKKNDDAWSITPVVYVPNVSTFLESACGSGTMALGMVLAMKGGKSIVNLPITQPSGMPINVSVAFDGKTFSYAQISGPVRKLAGGVVEIQKDVTFAIEQITSIPDLERDLTSNGLTDLYREVFGAAPYFESFSDDEVRDIFRTYVERGIFFIARGENGKASGFSSGTPLSEEPAIASCIAAAVQDVQNPWYFADLGVQEALRRQSIGEKLTRKLLEALPCDYVVVRTSEDNVVSQSLFRKIDFQPIPGVIQQVKQLRTNGTVRTDRRIFFSKNL